LVFYTPPALFSQITEETIIKAGVLPLRNSYSERSLFHLELFQTGLKVKLAFGIQLLLKEWKDSSFQHIGKRNHHLKYLTTKTLLNYLSEKSGRNPIDSKDLPFTRIQVK